MGEQKHTPGPWHVDPATDLPLGVIDDFADGICEVQANDKTRATATPEQEANAALIAAAPDMYEALRALVSVKEPTDEQWVAVHHALAKAEGRA